MRKGVADVHEFTADSDKILMQRNKLMYREMN